MARRAGRRPLYDLIGTGPSRDGPTPRPSTPEPEGSATPDEQPANFPRSVRVPTGYVYLSLAIIVALCIGTYVVGFRRAEAVYEGELDRERFSALDGVPRASDPLAGAAGDRSVNETSGGGLRPFRPTTGQPPEYGPVESDPRKPGLNYFVLITTHREGARKVAQFCRERRLEAYVVPANNSARNFQVIVLPGFVGGSQNSATVQSLRRQIDQMIEEWHRKVNSRDNFGYYPVRYDG